MRSKCKNVNGKVVCGMLHSGGSVPKSGTCRLSKGEKVYTPQQLNAACKCSHKTKKGAAGKHKKKCSCKHH